MVNGTTVFVVYPENRSETLQHVTQLLDDGLLWIDDSIRPRVCYVVNGHTMDRTFQGKWEIAFHSPDCLVLRFKEEKDAAMFLLKYS